MCSKGCVLSITNATYKFKSSIVAHALTGFAVAAAADPVASVSVKFDNPIFNGSGYDNVDITHGQSVNYIVDFNGATKRTLAG